MPKSPSKADDFRAIFEQISFIARRRCILYSERGRGEKDAKKRRKSNALDFDGVRISAESVHSPARQNYVIALCQAENALGVV